MTACFTAIRLIWKHVIFLEKMSQDYRGERWKRFIKLVSPSSCQSVAVPGRAHSGSAPAVFPKCLVMCCQPLSLRMFTASTFPGQEHLEPPLLCSAWSPSLLIIPLSEHHKQLLLKEVVSSTNPGSSTCEGILPGTAPFAAFWEGHLNASVPHCPDMSNIPLSDLQDQPAHAWK